MPKNTKGSVVEEALADSENFLVFKAKIESNKVKSAPLELRMQFVVVGLQIGLTPETALQLANVSQSELSQWLAIPENKELYDRAYLFCQAQLEFILFQTATRNAELALKLLERRDPEKWKINSVKKPVKTENAPVVSNGYNFSDILKKKQMSLGKEEFDVEFTAPKTP